MIFAVQHGKIMMFQRCANTLERGTGISGPGRVYCDSTQPAIPHTSPSVGGDMMDVIFTPEFQERFWAKVNKDAPNGCWEWVGHVRHGLRGGYGTVCVGPHMRGARPHRIAYLLSGHSIPEGMVLDHLCRNRTCVNPEHLEPVTNHENILRGDGPTAQNAIKTHCPKGHPYSGSNLHIRKSGSRRCRACEAERTRQYEATPEGLANKQARAERANVKRKEARRAKALARAKVTEQGEN